jgi:glycosyltransferase involved in cell wall biosynthesis
MPRGVCRAPSAKIDLIAHGIPDAGFVDPTDFKDQFGVEGKVVLLTFGLLSPEPGVEYVLNALPEIVAEFPEVVYIVLGATHPNKLREPGEAYQASLEKCYRNDNLEKAYWGNIQPAPRGQADFSKPGSTSTRIKNGLFEIPDRAVDLAAAAKRPGPSLVVADPSATSGSAHLWRVGGFFP